MAGHHPNPIADERGMTLIEVMVTALVLVVGLLGVLAMVDTGNQTTRRSLAREQGTVLTRDVLERAYALSYPQLAASNAPTLFKNSLKDSTTAIDANTFSLTRRGMTYQVNVTTCRVDDPSDGIGAVDYTYCNYKPATGNGGGSSTAAASLVLQLGGVSLNGTGSVLSRVCDALARQDPNSNALLAALGGTDGNLLNTLVGGGAGVQVCPSGTPGGFALDSDPNDFTRVTVATTWNNGGSSASQTTLVPNPGTPNTASGGTT